MYSLRKIKHGKLLYFCLARTTLERYFIASGLTLYQISRTAVNNTICMNDLNEPVLWLGFYSSALYERLKVTKRLQAKVNPFVFQRSCILKYLAECHICSLLYLLSIIPLSKRIWMNSTFVS